MNYKRNYFEVGLRQQARKAVLCTSSNSISPFSPVEIFSKVFSHNSMHKYSIVPERKRSTHFPRGCQPFLDLIIHFVITWHRQRTMGRMTGPPSHISKLWEQVQSVEWELLGEKSPGHREDKWQSAYAALHIYIPLIRFPQYFSSSLVEILVAREEHKWQKIAWINNKWQRLSEKYDICFRKAKAK